MAYRIAVLQGDGIGPEVCREAMRVLDALTDRADSPDFEVQVHEAGVGLYQRTGEALPSTTYKRVRDADAVLLGAMGDPDVTLEDGTEVQGRVIIRLRKELGLYAGVRPIRSYEGLPGVTRPVDFVVVRENTEGLFASFSGGAEIHDEVVADTMMISRAGTARVSRFAFGLARRRTGRLLDGQQRVSCVDKANVFRSLAFFRRVFTEVAELNSDVAASYELIDALALALIQRPEEFDVLVMENMFGDIVSDLASFHVGGLGMAPSADIGDDHAIFQPAHGTAPTLAGRDVANPLATILSTVMLLDWLGERHGDDSARNAARLVEDAVARVIRERRVTADLGGRATTQEVGKAVADLVRTSHGR